nr:MAG TPA: hypothetical protein [Caudoviricetes sp.]
MNTNQMGIDPTTGAVNTGAPYNNVYTVATPEQMKQIQQTGSTLDKIEIRRDMSRVVVPKVLDEFSKLLQPNDPFLQNINNYKETIAELQREQVWTNQVGHDDGTNENGTYRPASPYMLNKIWQNHKELRDTLIKDQRIMAPVIFSKLATRIFSQPGMIEGFRQSGLLTDEDATQLTNIINDQQTPIDFLAMLNAIDMEVNAWLIRTLAAETNIVQSPQNLVRGIIEVINNGTDKRDIENKVLEIVSAYGLIQPTEMSQYSMNFGFAETEAQRIMRLSVTPTVQWSPADIFLYQDVYHYATSGQLPQGADQRGATDRFVEAVNNGTFNVNTAVIPTHNNQPAGNYTTGGAIIDKGNNNNNNQGGNEMFGNVNFGNNGMMNGGFVQQPQQGFNNGMGMVNTQMNQFGQPMMNNNGYMNNTQPMYNSQPMIPQQQFGNFSQPNMGYIQPQTFNNGYVNLGFNQPAVGPGLTAGRPGGYLNNTVPQNPGYIQQQPGQNNLSVLPQGFGAMSDMDRIVPDNAILTYQVGQYGQTDPVTNTPILTLTNPQTGEVHVVSTHYYNLRRQCLTNPTYAQTLLQQANNKNQPIYAQPQLVEIPNNYNQQPQQLMGYNQFGQPMMPQQQFGFSQPNMGLQAPNILNGYTAGPNAGGLQTTGILPGFN